MKLVTFGVKTPLGEIRRVGAVSKAGSIVDLTSAREAFLNSRGVYDAAAAAAECPDRMLDFIKGGEAALTAAREAMDFVAAQGACETGSRIVFQPEEVRILTPFPVPIPFDAFP